MANANIGGLVSGLDSASIVSQLMQLEARPQAMLKARMGVEQRTVTSLQSVNAKLAAIATKAAELAKPAGWAPVSATSSNDKVRVTTSNGATTASISMTVDKVATATIWDLGVHSLADKVLSDGSRLVTFTKPDGGTIDLDTGDGSVQGLVNAINGSASGASASLVKVDSTNYRLVVTAGQTGATTMGMVATPPSSATVQLTGTTPVPGQQAQITVGTDVITQDSNTFAGLMPGVDVTLLAGADNTNATITVAQDSQSMIDKVKALVDAVNSVMDDIGKLTAYDATTKASGPLAGDATLRDIKNQLLETVTRGVAGASLAPYGIQTDRYGKLVFDADKFKAAYGADPTATAAQFTAAGNGFAVSLETVSKRFSDSIDGTLTSAIKGRNASVTRMQKDIESWDVRLEQRKSSLERQYAALEVALGKLQSQSTWLAGQIGSLPKMSSGN